MMGAAKIEQLPPDRPARGGLRRPFQRGQVQPDQRAGRPHRLARASNEPGRTREVNFFVLTEQMRLVDLPGYGFARASKDDREASSRTWAATICAGVRT
jgi:GTP-binding protein